MSFADSDQSLANRAERKNFFCADKVVTGSFDIRVALELTKSGAYGPSRLLDRPVTVTRSNVNREVSYRQLDYGRPTRRRFA
jgi:hypothetical protein